MEFIGASTVSVVRHARDSSCEFIYFAVSWCGCAGCEGATSVDVHRVTVPVLDYTHRHTLKGKNKMARYTRKFGRFTATYETGDSYITVWAFGREVDVINISHLDGNTITRKQFVAEVRDSEAYIDSAYSTEDILMIPLG